jgi:hypothetical protein
MRIATHYERIDYDDIARNGSHTNRFLGDVSHADISSPVIRTVLSDIDQTD